MTLATSAFLAPAAVRRPHRRRDLLGADADMGEPPKGTSRIPAHRPLPAHPVVRGRMPLSCAPYGN
ncbi:MAG: hypothetical protein ACLTSX_05075 [Collinsella sp.]